MKRLNLYFLGLILIFTASYSSANLCLQLPIDNSKQLNFHYEAITITSYDTTPIAATLFLPAAEPPALGFPTIVFISSWNFNEYEYIQQAKRLVQRGYAVLSYATRGFGCSGGMAEVASENDIDDLSATIDYLVARNDIDASNIAVSGVSYGAGIALIGLAKDSRIKTAAAMSGWGSLFESLYGQQTTRQFWGNFLTISGNITGTLDPQLERIFSDLQNNENIEQAKRWSNTRSPSQYINLVNERNAPVFISHNFSDFLFNINSILDYYHQVTGPKYLEINQGTHASTEIPGLFGFENSTWNNAFRWFDYWLKGERNNLHGIEISENMENISLLTDIEYTRENYSDIADTHPEFQHTQYFLKPPATSFGPFGKGSMSSEPSNNQLKTHTIYSGLDSGASTGIPVLSAILDGHAKTPVALPLNLINPIHGIRFISEPTDKKIKIRGIPELQLSIQSSSDHLQLVAYLYDVDKHGKATLITHGPASRFNLADNTIYPVQFKLLAAAYDLEKSHSLALVIDTFDLLYHDPFSQSDTWFGFEEIHFYFGKNTSSEPQLTPASISIPSLR